MAHAAFWDSIGPLRGMLHMTILTANLCPVFGSLSPNGLGLLGMAVYALSISYSWGRSLGLDLPRSFG